MDKELLTSKLKTSLGITKISDRTMDVYVNAILPLVAAEEDVNDTFIETHTAVLKAMAGQISHDSAEEINRYKREAEKKPQPEAKPEPEPMSTQGEDFKKLMSEMEQLKERLLKQEQGAAMTSRKEEILRVMREQGANDAYVLKNVIKNANIDITKDITTQAKELLDAYDVEYKEARGDGARPRVSKPGGEDKSKALDDYFRKKAGEGKFPKSQTN